MKRILSLCLILMLGFFIFLTGCGNKQALPDVQGSINVTVFKTALTVKTHFYDTFEHDLYYDNVKPTVILSSDIEGVVKEISRKDVSVTKPSVDQSVENPEISKNMSGADLDFSGLNSDTNYILKLVISAKGNQKTIATKEVKTISGGESSEDPILIDSLDMLLGMSKSNDAYYKLTKDIDCGGSLSSIFNSSNHFSGVLDGDGHKIINAKFDSNAYSGLLGYMTGATVKNLVLENVSYDATRTDTWLGGLAGYAKNCTIDNVSINGLNFSHGGQSTKSAYIGGLIGKTINSKITNCTITGLEIKVPKSQLNIVVGGLIGNNENTSVVNCNVTGNISATLYYNSNVNGSLHIGGFVAVNDSNQKIENCWTKTNITVTEPTSVTSTGNKTYSVYVGGFVAGNIHDTSRINGCAAIGDIDVTLEYAYNVYVGGFAAMFNTRNKVSLVNCVYAPVEKGINVKLMDYKPSTGEDTETEGDNKEELVPYAFVSLTIAKVNAESTITNVMAYQNLLTIVNQHVNVYVVESNISTNIDAFSDAIKEIINQLA